MSDDALISLGEDFERAIYIEKRGSSSHDYGAATGETWTARIAATPTGNAIGSLTATVSEFGSTGYYKAAIDKATVASDLSSYVGKIVYLIWAKSGDVDRRWVRLRVVTDAEVGALTA
jgi:hypothetical protein